MIILELYTGAAVSYIREVTYNKFGKCKDKLLPVNIILRDYSKLVLDLAGVAMVKVQCGEQCEVVTYCSY